MALIPKDLPEEARLVAADVLASLAGINLQGRRIANSPVIFEPDRERDEDTFRIPEPFAGRGVITNGAFTAVPWEFSCRHVGVFQGAQPTERQLVIRGTTIVDTTRRRPLFHRYVAWSDVFAALGMAVSSRPTVPDLPQSWRWRIEPER